MKLFNQTYTYDGDGVRVKKVAGGETTVYVNRYYEKNTSIGTITKYYYHGDRLVALNKGGTLQYVSQDHLTGTSLTTDSSGNQVAEVKYLPFGGTRSSSGTLSTDKKFTGQRLDGTGMYFYNARYYDPNLGRFISPDPTIPNLSAPQALNRYTYVYNNPLRFTDPTGFCAYNDDPGCWDYDSPVWTDPDGIPEDAGPGFTPPSNNSVIITAPGSGDDGGSNHTAPLVIGTTITGAAVCTASTLGACGLLIVGVTTGVVVKHYYGDQISEGFRGISNFFSKSKEDKKRQRAKQGESEDTASKIADFVKNPQNWEKVSEKTEPSTRKGNRGGTSTEEEFRNKNTGQSLNRHTVRERNGNILDSHFR